MGALESVGQSFLVNLFLTVTAGQRWNGRQSRWGEKTLHLWSKKKIKKENRDKTEQIYRLFPI